MKLGAALVVDHRGRLVRHDETQGSRQCAEAMARRCSCPPDSVEVSRSSKPASPTRGERVVDCGWPSNPGALHATSSRTCYALQEPVPPGRWKIIAVPPGSPSTSAAGSLDVAQQWARVRRAAAERRLARPVGADHGDQLACGHVAADVIERRRSRRRRNAATHRPKRAQAPAPRAAGRARTRSAATARRARARARPVGR